MKLFTCDKCGKEFPQAIEEEFYKDEHGVNHVLDFCAPCKNNLESKKEKLKKDELGGLIKKKW